MSAMPLRSASRVLASLAGNVTTSGNQSFDGAVTLASDATLTTTSNGNVASSAPSMARMPSPSSTNGSGDTTFGGAVGGASGVAPVWQ